MKQGWEIKKLGEVCKFFRGLTYSKGDEVDFSCKMVLRSNNIELESNTLVLDDMKYLRDDFDIDEDKKVKPNSILICMSNGSKQHVGKVAYIGECLDYAFGGFMGLIYPNTNTSAKFTYYACISSSFKHFLEGIGNGIGITNLRFSDLSNFLLPVPPLPEQEKIVSELDCLSGIIEKKRQQLKELDALALSIFYEMFGNPVDNERGWEVKSIKEIGKVITGNTPSRSVSEYYNSKDIEWIKTDNIESGKIHPTIAKEYLSKDGMMKGRVVECGAILVTCIAGSIASIGGCCIADRKVAFNQQINAVVPIGDINSLFLYYCLILSKRLIQDSASNGMKHLISKSNFEQIPLPLPPLPLQQSFASKIEAIEQQKALIKQSIAEVETLFNARMQEYFE